jgi:hypothetical protein
MIAIQDESLKLDKEIMPVVFKKKPINTLIWIKLNRLQECAIKPTKLGELNGDNSQKTGTKHNNDSYQRRRI